jgi:hypothetical protein
MSNINWSLIKLKGSPFSIIPDKETKGLIWAGFQTNKRQIESAIKNIYSSRDSKVVLNVSRWGGGKTHAAYYFSNGDNIMTLLPEEVPTPLSVIVLTSKEGNDAAYDFFKKVIEGITIERIIGAVAFMRGKEGDDQAFNKIKTFVNAAPLAKIVWLLGSTDEEESFEASEMIFNGTTSAQRKKFKLVRGIEDTTDRFKILSCIFKLLSEYDADIQFNKPRKLLLWMDEVEALIVYTPKQYIPFTQALRELVDMTPTDFCFLMNFSLSDYDNLRTLEYIIGKALSDRISHKIIFEEPTLEEADAYVYDLLQEYRLTPGIPESYFPFTKESLDQLLIVMEERQVPLMPRNVNKYVEYVIDSAFEKNMMDGVQPIVSEFIKSLDYKSLL